MGRLQVERRIDEQVMQSPSGVFDSHSRIVTYHEPVQMETVMGARRHRWRRTYPWVLKW
jgi:hypothetical protein